MKIPFVDLGSLHSEIAEELREVFDRVLSNSTFVLGPEVHKFEAEFAAYTGTAHCVAVNTGTAALHLALASMDIGPGDEVITVTHTFIATAEAISAVGARPVFVDIDPVSYAMDPALLESAITNKTRAIIPVHIYGQVADMDPSLRSQTAMGSQCSKTRARPTVRSTRVARLVHSAGQAVSVSIPGKTSVHAAKAAR